MLEGATLSEDIHRRQYHLRISPATRLCSNVSVNNPAIADIRRRRLRQLIDEQYDGVDASFAAKIDRQASYVSFLFTKNDKGGYRRNIGEKLARHIEKAAGLPSGWLDGEQQQAAPRIEEPRALPRKTQEQILDILSRLSPIQQEKFLGAIKEVADVNEIAVRHLGTTQRIFDGESPRQGTNKRRKTDE